MPASDYPFRFYGHKPSDWTEGGNAGHCFTLCFSRAPTDDELLRIAAAYEFALSSGSAEPSDKPWQWSDRFAMFDVGERGNSYARVPHFMGPVTRFALAAHEIVPLEEVAFHGVMGIASDDAWTRWSKAQGAPSPKPAFQLSTHWASSVESSLPVPAANPVFEQGRVDGRVAMADDALRKILETERKRGTVGLAPFAKELNEPEVSWPAEVLAKLQLAEATDDGKAEVVARIVERPVGFLPKSYAAERVFWLSEEGERCDAKLPYFRQRSLKADPQGKRLLAASTGRYGGEAYCLDLESGEHTSWYRDPPYYYGKGNLELHDVAWLEGGRSFAVALDKSLRIFEAAPTDPLNPVEVANQKVRVTRLQSARNGSVLIACGEKDVCVFALDRKRKLKKLAKWKLEAWGARELEDGRVIFRHRYKGPWYEVTDLDTALAELNPAPKRKAKERAV